MTPYLHHVALLVRSAKVAEEFCRINKFDPGPVEEFPSEGTREFYVGMPSDQGLLLIMEAIGPGPYKNALSKRGPGLHHIAVHVNSVAEYVTGLTGTGWLLHPSSLETYAHRKVVYLARPGLHALIEVEEQKGKSSSPTSQSFISDVFIEGDRKHQGLLDALGVDGLGIADKDDAAVVICGNRIKISSLADVPNN